MNFVRLTNWFSPKNYELVNQKSFINLKVFCWKLWNLLSILFGLYTTNYMVDMNKKFLLIQRYQVTNDFLVKLIRWHGFHYWVFRKKLEINWIFPQNYNTVRNLTIQKFQIREMIDLVWNDWYTESYWN